MIELPHIVMATGEQDLSAWARGRRVFLRQLLDEHGAVLLRGFSVHSPENFSQFMATVTSGALNYVERSSPRREVLPHANVFTSTEYPSDREIFLHNEQSYNLRFPLVIAFCCLQSASNGGSTPVADTRKILRRLSAPTIRTLHERGYLYVRNFGSVYGLPWETTFQTKSIDSVNRYCALNQITTKWKDSNRTLQTLQRRKVIAEHPRTKELCWFNHLTFFHPLTLDEDLRGRLYEQYRDEINFPNATFLGDGTPIGPEMIEELKSAYVSELKRFSWNNGDVLILDNMLCAHGRDCFVGERNVIAAMAEATAWSDVLPQSDTMLSYVAQRAAHGVCKNAN